VLHVGRVETSLRFYVDQLGSTVAWQFEDGGRPFAFSALPSVKPSLQLYLQPFAETGRGVLERLTTKLAVRIEDSTGAVVSEASCTPSAWRNGAWVLMSGANRGAYWHCR
jgi:hypothetical protein